MRALILTLAFVNLLYFGWAHWIDQPAGGRAAGGSVAALQLAPPVSQAAAASASSAMRCASLGPLMNRDAVGAVGTALRARSFSPHERVTQGEAPDGYWVYIDNLSDAESRASALKRLARAGVLDAAALATSGQVSVGLFSERSGADLRAAAVRSAGLEPVIKARLRLVEEYWFDVDSASDVPLPAVAALMAGINVDNLPAWGACPIAGAPAAVTP